MKKVVFLLWLCSMSPAVFATGIGKALPALNRALFRTPLSAALTRQTFAQLSASRQLADFSTGEKTLLLAHAFLRENQRWPRTVIVHNKTVVSPKNYTLQERQEVAVGNLLRLSLSQDATTDPRIRQALEELKTQFSPRRTHVFMLGQLNKWISTHATWPREHIPAHPGPLTSAEQTEIELARYANKICTQPTPALPDGMIEQIRFIRAAYDPAYNPTPVESKQKQLYQLLKDTYAWLQQSHRWPQESYLAKADLEETQLARRIREALALDANTYPEVFELARLKNHYQSLTKMTQDIPVPVPTGRQEYIYYTPESELGRTPILPTYDHFPDRVYAPPSFLAEEEDAAVLLKLRDWLKTHRTWPHIYSTTENPSEMQLAKNIQEMSHKHNSKLAKLRKQWRQQSLSKTLATQTPFEELVAELDEWLLRNTRWPEEEIIRFEEKLPVFVAEEEYTSEQIQETSLARRVLAFAAYASEFQANEWKQEPSEHPHFLLQFPSEFDNPQLEQFRQLYRQYNDY